MKKRWLRILLAALVLGVWGGVIGKVFHQIHPDPVVAEPAVVRSGPRSVHADTVQTDIPHLARDPFLDSGSGPEHAAPPTKGSATVHPHQEPASANQPWPTIAYTGMIRDQGAAPSMIAFIEMNGQHLLIKEGSEEQGLKVLSIVADSVTVEWSHERRTFRRP